VPHRIGLIVPSSNTTMETELPRILRASDDEYTFHSSRVRMTSVDRDGLAAMVEQTSRAAEELRDAECDVIAYACLVAVMVRGPGAHLEAEKTITDIVTSGGRDTAVVSSAGALLDGIRALGAKRVAIVTPYVKSLTECVIEYLVDSNVEVVDSVSLEVSDNVAVGRIPSAQLEAASRQVGLEGADALVLSACVQMPSLPLVEPVQQVTGLPVLTAATATARSILTALGASTSVPAAHAGALLA
jgi:maleate isomerase